jgi:REP element-mobilizing transposase RayT
MVVPLAYANAGFTLSAGLTTFFLLIFVGTNSHLFDVRDLKSDRQADMLTLPRLLGVDRHRQFWFALNGLALVAVAWGWTRSLAVPSPEIAIPCVVVNLLTLRWIVMPNHLHGIVLINPINSVGANGRLPLQKDCSHCRVPPMKKRSLPSFIAGYKSATTKRINTIRNAAGTPVWQRNYHEHIICSDNSLQYIQNNPATWQDDQLNPSNPSKF